MYTTGVAQVYLRARYEFFRWRCSLTFVQMVMLSFGMACLTGLAAQIRISLPFTPIPITGQTFAVLLAGVILGRMWGGVSQAFYVAAGAAGVPWFAGATGGCAILAGPSGGYLLGFIIAALFLGHLSDRYVRARRFLPLLGLMLIANFVFIHGLGLLQLAAWLAWAKGTAPGLRQLLLMGSAPFIPGDLLKIVVAAATACLLIPKEPFGIEKDGTRVQ